MQRDSGLLENMTNSRKNIYVKKLKNEFNTRQQPCGRQMRKSVHASSVKGNIDMDARQGANYI